MVNLNWSFYIIASIFFLTNSCKVNSNKISQSGGISNLNSKFEITLYEVVHEDELEFKNLSASIGEIENFKTIKELGIEDGSNNFFGVTTNNSYKDEILKSIQKVNNQKEKIKIMWSKEIIHNQIINEKNYYLYLLKDNQNKVTITKKEIVESKVISNPYSDFSDLLLTLNSSSSSQMNKLTKKAHDAGRRSIAIVLDNEVYSSPYVNNPIYGYKFSIGCKTLEEAKKLKMRIKNSQ